MRRRDWADNEAQYLFDMVRADRDDDEIIEAIAIRLRQACIDGDESELTGPTEMTVKP